MFNFLYEKECLKNYNMVGGIDEAGRGPLAGPVVAACVAIDKKFKINNKKLRLINDSKKLSPKVREELYDIIISEIPNIGIGICDSQTIDRLNVLQATLLAMKKAIEKLNVQPDSLLIDGCSFLPNVKIKQTTIIKGDSKVFVIAAASIVAKVGRDRLIRVYHNQFPEYGFDRHKGYGTKLHLENLLQHGPCKIHRLSFSPVSRAIN